MTGIILCEGETDQILLSKFFCSRYGYQFNNKATRQGVTFSKQSQDGIIRSVYTRESSDLKTDDLLYIVSTAGKNNFPSILQRVLTINRIDSNIFFDSISVVTDHDSDKEVGQLQECLENILQQAAKQSMSFDMVWQSYDMTTDFHEYRHFQFQMLIVPVDHDGALETFLLNALREKAENVCLVDESRKLIDNLVEKKKAGIPFPKEVLKGRRLQVKAPLSVFLGITNPERIFSTFEETLNSVPWEKYAEVQKGFQSFDLMYGKNRSVRC